MNLQALDLDFQAEPNAPHPVIKASENTLELILNCCDREFTKTFYIKFEFINYQFYSSDCVISSDTFSHLYMIEKKILYDYSFFENKNSELINSFLDKRKIFPYSDKDTFVKMKHFVFSFRDSTFECISEGFNYRVMDRNC